MLADLYFSNILIMNKFIINVCHQLLTLCFNKTFKHMLKTAHLQQTVTFYLTSILPSTMLIWIDPKSIIALYTQD